MALLDAEHFNRETNLSLSNWFNFGLGSGNVSADGSGPFNYGRSCQVPYGLGRTIPARSAIWFQSHFWLTSAPNGDRSYVLQDSGTQQVGVTFTSDLRCTIQVPGGNFSSALPVMTFNAWYFIQIRVFIADSGGTVDVYVNGTLKHSYVGDTKTTANNTVNQWALFNCGSNRYANVLLYDETGSAPNAKTPETRIFADLPQNAGAATGFTPSAGANWQCVDEQPNDGDTTYVSAAAATVDDTYSYPAAIPGGSIVYAVMVELVARKDDAGLNDLDSLIRSGGTTYAAGDTFGLTATYQRYRSVATVDPATGAAWSVSAANTAEVGVRRKT